MEINRREIENCVADTLDGISRRELPTHMHPCPHCGVPVRYPTVARKGDIDDFERLMRTAYKVMDEYGITGNLLADIQARCYTEIAKRSSKN